MAVLAAGLAQHLAQQAAQRGDGVVGVATGDAVVEVVVLAAAVLRQDPGQIAGIAVQRIGQQLARLPRLPVRQDEMDRQRGNRGAGQRVEQPRQHHRVAVAHLVHQHHHEQRDHRRGHAVAPMAGGEKRHAGQRDQRQLP